MPLSATQFLSLLFLELQRKQQQNENDDTTTKREPATTFTHDLFGRERKKQQQQAQHEGPLFGFKQTTSFFLSFAFPTAAQAATAPFVSFAIVDFDNQ